jgi:microcystin-dependent protein
VGATPNGMVYPEGTDALDAAVDMQDLAESVENWVDTEAGTIEYVQEVAADLVGVPFGSIVLYAGIAEPVNWMFCRGQAISRTTYPLLFAAIGTNYGPGDGTTTFNLPDLRARTPVAYNDGTAAAPLVGLWILGLNEKDGNPAPSMVSHVHDKTHGHSGVSSEPVGNPVHQHPILGRISTISGGDGNYFYVPNAGGDLRSVNWDPATIGHHHDISIGNFIGSTAAQTTGGDIGVTNYPPGISLNFMIRVT